MKVKSLGTSLNTWPAANTYLSCYGCLHSKNGSVLCLSSRTAVILFCYVINLHTHTHSFTHSLQGWIKGILKGDQGVIVICCQRQRGNIFESRQLKISRDMQKINEAACGKLTIATCVGIETCHLFCFIIRFAP